MTTILLTILLAIGQKIICPPTADNQPYLFCYCDVDFDGDCDLVDFGVFQRCFGRGVLNNSPENCYLLDFNSDWFVWPGQDMLAWQLSQIQTGWLYNPIEHCWFKMRCHPSRRVP